MLIHAGAGNARAAMRVHRCMDKILNYPAHKGPGKTRIVVTCPQTGVVVITRLTYDEMVRPRLQPRLFACACGDTHKLAFAGKIRRRQAS